MKPPTTAAAMIATRPMRHRKDMASRLRVLAKCPIRIGSGSGALPRTGRIAGSPARGASSTRRRRSSSAPRAQHVRGPAVPTGTLSKRRLTRRCHSVYQVTKPATNTASDPHDHRDLCHLDHPPSDALSRRSRRDGPVTRDQGPYRRQVPKAPVAAAGRWSRARATGDRRPGSGRPAPEAARSLRVDTLRAQAATSWSSPRYTASTMHDDQQAPPRQVPAEDEEAAPPRPRRRYAAR